MGTLIPLLLALLLGSQAQARPCQVALGDLSSSNAIHPIWYDFRVSSRADEVYQQEVYATGNELTHDSATADYTFEIRHEDIPNQGMWGLPGKGVTEASYFVLLNRKQEIVQRLELDSVRWTARKWANPEDRFATVYSHQWFVHTTGKAIYHMLEDRTCDWDAKN